MTSIARINSLTSGNVITVCIKHLAMQTYWGTKVYLSAFSVLALHGGDVQMQATAI
jgi:hypothetical protein